MMCPPQLSDDSRAVAHAHPALDPRPVKHQIGLVGDMDDLYRPPLSLGGAGLIVDARMAVRAEAEALIQLAIEVALGETGTRLAV